jgi:two-component system, NarL family, nitrate/nitrite sensor histidine kinase NarX
MITKFIHKNLTNVVIILVIIVFCTTGSYWWITYTNTSYIKTQKQLNLASNSCQTLMLDIAMHQELDSGPRQINSESGEMLQRLINEINIANPARFNPSIKTLPMEFERLVSLWQSGLSAQVRKASNETNLYINTSDRTGLIKNLNYLCTGFKQISDEIENIVASNLTINNILHSFSIVILSLLAYLIFNHYRILYSKDLSGNNTNNHNEDGANTSHSYEINNNSLTTDNKTEIQQYISSLNIAHEALIQLVEEPESTEPFSLLLNEINKLTNATSSAIYITSNSTPQLTLLAATDINDQGWSDTVPSRILPKVTSFDKTNKITEIYEETVQPEYKYICVQLHQGAQDFSLLVLKLALNINITDSIILTLLEYSDRLANIVSSVRLARVKLRHAQYEERAVIARELHDSLAQSLSYLKIQTSRLQSILTGSDIQAYSKSMEIDAMMQDLRSNLNIAYRHLRELISTFRLTMGGKNFSQALTDSVEEFEKRSSIAFDIDNRLPADILSVIEETQLLHIIRESLSNVVRHSQAKSALISIHYDESGQITTLIEDDGIGLLDISNPEQHFGIIIMQERAHSISGNISLTERVNGGACLKIVFRASKHIDETSNF